MFGMGTGVSPSGMATEKLNIASRISQELAKNVSDGSKAEEILWLSLTTD